VQSAHYSALSRTEFKPLFVDIAQLLGLCMQIVIVRRCVQSPSESVSVCTLCRR